MRLLSKEIQGLEKNSEEYLKLPSTNSVKGLNAKYPIKEYKRVKREKHCTKRSEKRLS